MPDLEIMRGNSDSLVIQINKRSDGTPVDLTGATIKFSAKRHPDFAAVLISKATGGQGITIDGDQVAHKGKATIALAPGDTHDLPADVSLWYDVQTLKDGDTDTPLSGRLTVKPDVTR